MNPARASRAGPAERGLTRAVRLAGFRILNTSPDDGKNPERGTPMSDTTTAAHAAPAPAATTLPQDAPAPTPAPQADQDPNWLPARLERERKAIAKRFGAESLDDVEKTLAKAREIERAQLSETDKLRAELKELQAAAKQRDELAASLAVYARSLTAGLTEAQRAAVEAIAGDNPAAIVRAVDTLRPTWAAVAAPAAPVTLPAPANTAGANAAPAASAIPSGPNHRLVWEGMRKTNPLGAAQYLLLHESEIFAPQAGPQ